MKKMKKRSKGFTLTELAIVIAVIAILIAVLVPTFTSLINKAEESADKQMIYNVNNVLAIEDTTNSIDSLEEALETATKAGYNMDALSPTSDGNLIVYDQASASFALVSESGELVYGKSGVDIDLNAPTTWYIVDEATYNALNTVESAATHAQLAKTSIKSATADSTDKAVHTASYIAKGEWTGELSYTGMGGIYSKLATGITEVSYTSKTVENDKGYSINISYAVRDDVKSVAIVITESGNYTIQKSCSENTLTTIKVADGVTGVTVEVKSDNTSVVLTDGVVEVTVTQNGTNITDEVVDSISLANGATFSDNGVLQLGTEKYPYLISNETEFYNIANGSRTYDSTTKSYTNSYKFYKLVADITLTSNTTKYNSSLKTYYHTSTSSIKLIVFDGDNYTVSLANDVSGSNSVFYNLYYYNTIKNVTFNFTGTSGQQIARTSYCYSSAQTSYFINVTTKGDLSVNGNNGTFITYGKGYLDFTNCVNKVNYTGIGTSSDYNAAFIGYTYGTLHASFNSCTNEGNIICGRAAMFVGNIPSSTNYLYLSVNNCSNEGIIRSTYTGSGYTPYYYIAMQDNLVKSISVDGETCTYNELPALENTFHGPVDVMTISLNNEGYYEVTKSNQSGIATYELSVGLYVNISNGTNRYYITVTVDASEVENGTYVSALQKLQFMDLKTYLSKSGKTEFNENSSDVTAIGNGYMVYVDNAWYYLINDSGCYLTNGIANIGMVTSSVYNSNGKLLSSASA